MATERRKFLKNKARFHCPIWALEPDELKYTGVYLEVYKIEGAILRRIYLVNHGPYCVFGREAKQCQEFVKHESLSRQHAVLIHTHLGLLLADLHSAHGSYLNDTLLEPGWTAQVFDGDVFRFGGSKRKYKVKGMGVKRKHTVRAGFGQQVQHLWPGDHRKKYQEADLAKHARAQAMSQLNSSHSNTTITKAPAQKSSSSSSKSSSTSSSRGTTSLKRKHEEVENTNKDNDKAKRDRRARFADDSKSDSEPEKETAQPESKELIKNVTSESETKVEPSELVVNPEAEEKTRLEEIEISKGRFRRRTKVKRPSVIKCRQILLKHTECRRPYSARDPTEAVTRSQDLALAQIRMFRRQVSDHNRQEAKFSQLAAKYSDCGTHTQSGYLGRLSFKDAPLEKAAFLLEVGEISVPILSETGVHLILRVQ